MRQVGYLQELCRDTRSAEHEKVTFITLIHDFSLHLPLIFDSWGRKTKAFALSGWWPQKLRKSALTRPAVTAEHLRSIAARHCHSRNMIAFVHKQSQVYKWRFGFNSALLYESR